MLLRGRLWKVGRRISVELFRRGPSGLWEQALHRGEKEVRGIGWMSLLALVG